MRIDQLAPIVIATTALLGYSAQGQLPPGYEDEMYCPPRYCDLEITYVATLGGPQSIYHECYDPYTDDRVGEYWCGALSTAIAPIGWIASPELCGSTRPVFNPHDQLDFGPGWEETMHCPVGCCDMYIEYERSLGGPLSMFHECYNPSTDESEGEFWTGSFTHAVAPEGWIADPEPCGETRTITSPNEQMDYGPGWVETMHCPEGFCDMVCEYELSRGGPQSMFHECYNPTTEETVGECWTGSFTFEPPPEGWVANPETCEHTRTISDPREQQDFRPGWVENMHCPEGFCDLEIEYERRIGGPSSMFHECYNPTTEQTVGEFWSGTHTHETAPEGWVENPDRCDHKRTVSSPHEQEDFGPDWVETIHCPDEFCDMTITYDHPIGGPQSMFHECFNPVTFERVGEFWTGSHTNALAPEGWVANPIGCDETREIRVSSEQLDYDPAWEEVMHCPSGYCDLVLEYANNRGGPQSMFHECYEPHSGYRVGEFWTGSFTNAHAPEGWVANPETCIYTRPPILSPHEQLDYPYNASVQNRGIPTNSIYMMIGVAVAFGVVVIARSG